MKTLFGCNTKLANHFISTLLEQTKQPKLIQVTTEFINPEPFFHEEQFIFQQHILYKHQYTQKFIKLFFLSFLCYKIYFRKLYKVLLIKTLFDTVIASKTSKYYKKQRIHCIIQASRLSHFKVLKPTIKIPLHKSAQTFCFVQTINYKCSFLKQKEYQKIGLHKQAVTEQFKGQKTSTAKTSTSEEPWQFTFLRTRQHLHTHLNKNSPIIESVGFGKRTQVHKS